MPKRLDGSDRGVLISRGSLSRLAKQGHRADDFRRNVHAPPLRTAFDDGSPVRIGRTTEKWPKGTTSEIELILETSCEEEGTAAETLEVHNLAYDVNSGVRCVVAQAENACWYLVVAESCPASGSAGCECPAIGGQDMTTLPGYDETKTQILGHDSACLKWFDVVECPEESPP